MRALTPKASDAAQDLLERKKLSTDVVAWYAHQYEGQVRGPYGRWFRIDDGERDLSEKYPVAPIAQEVAYAAAALNLAPVLAQAVLELTAHLATAKEALEFYASEDSWWCSMDGENSIIDCDDVEFLPRADVSISAGGKRARQALAEMEK